MGCGGSKYDYPPPPEPEDKPLQLPTEEELAAQKRKEEADAINAKILSAPKPQYQSEPTFERQFHKGRGQAGGYNQRKKHVAAKRVVGDSASSHIGKSEAATINSRIAAKLADNRVSRAITRRSTRRGRATNASEAGEDHHREGTIGGAIDSVQLLVVGFLGKIRHAANTSGDGTSTRGSRKSRFTRARTTRPDRARASDGVDAQEPADAAAAPADAAAGGDGGAGVGGDDVVTA